MSTPEQIARTASTASIPLKACSSNDRQTALTAIHTILSTQKPTILAANAADLSSARILVSQGKLSTSLLSRLDLSKPGKYEDMLAGILQVRDLPDPVGVTTLARRLDTGLELFRVTSPIGVLLVIFEARPEVIANIASLALKSGNAVILKGGKESAQTFAAMAKAIQSALETTKVPKGAVQLVESREEVSGLLAMDRWIDLVIPRGGNELVRYIKENTRIPVMGHADGLCAVYVHADADAQKAVSVVVDAKTNYPAACNAAETLLLHKDVVTSGLWWEITGALVKEGVTLKCDERSKASLVGHGLGDRIVEATEKDYDTEFLDLVMAVKVVDNVDEAIEHINLHSSGHTDAILTENEEVAEGFMKRVDSAGVYWNASTRFADGFRYGFGTEVGISTNKIHARGPVGLEGLMIYKYVLKGNGHIVASYGSEEGKRIFLHEDIPF